MPFVEFRLVKQFSMTEITFCYIEVEDEDTRNNFFPEESLNFILWGSPLPVKGPSDKVLPHNVKYNARAMTTTNIPAVMVPTTVYLNLPDFFIISALSFSLFSESKIKVEIRTL